MTKRFNISSFGLRKIILPRMRDLIRASSLDLASRANVLLARHAIILLGEQERVTNLLRTSVREATLDIYLSLTISSNKSEPL